MVRAIGVRPLPEVREGNRPSDVRARRPTIGQPEAPTAPPLDALAGRLALRLDEVAATVGVSRSAIERERRAGRFPKPDRVVGRMPLWTPATFRAWLEGGRVR